MFSSRALRSLRTPGQASQTRLTHEVRPLNAAEIDQSQAYNEEMKKAMGWDDADPFQYHYDRGLYYHEVMPNLLCGSQPRNIDDIVKLKNNIGATVIVNVGHIHCSESCITCYASHLWQLTCHHRATCMCISAIICYLSAAELIVVQHSSGVKPITFIDALGMLMLSLLPAATAG